jgi:hypothetical protein
MSAYVKKIALSANPWDELVDRGLMAEPRFPRPVEDG